MRGHGIGTGRGLAVAAAGLVLVLGGCTSTVSGRPVAAPGFREVPSSAVPAPAPSTGASPSTGDRPAGSTAVCTVLERDVPDTLDAVNTFVVAVSTAPSTLDPGDPAVRGAVSSLRSTVSALDLAVADAGAALPTELGRETVLLARSLEQVGGAIEESDASTFNDAVDAVNDSYTAAESHCRFV